MSHKEHCSHGIYGHFALTINLYLFLIPNPRLWAEPRFLWKNLPNFCVKYWKNRSAYKWRNTVTNGVSIDYLITHDNVIGHCALYSQKEKKDKLRYKKRINWSIKKKDNTEFFSPLSSKMPAIRESNWFKGFCSFVPMIYRPFQKWLKWDKTFLRQHKCAQLLQTSDWTCA